jgi:hypothetical protein
MPKRTNRTVQVMSLVEYCHNREKRKKFGFVIENGAGRYTCGITEKEINDLFPTPEILFFNENSDHSGDWQKGM